MSEKRLWKRFGGEPFMVNPALGILNPRKGKGMAARRRRRGKAYMRWVSSFRRKSNPRRRRSYRRNPFPVAGLAINHRRRYRRNPSLAGLQLPAINSVLYAGAGFVGAGAVETLVMPYLPLSVQSSQLGKWAVRIGAVVGVGFLAKVTLGKEKAKMVAIGGGAYVLVQALKEFMPAGTIPGLNAYRPMGAYRQPRQIGAPQSFGSNVVGMNPASDTAVRFRRF